MVVLFSVIHIVAHMRNFVSHKGVSELIVGGIGDSIENVGCVLRSVLIRSGFVGFLEYNFATGPGITGWIMTAVLGSMVWFAMEKRRRANFER